MRCIDNGDFVGCLFVDLKKKLSTSLITRFCLRTHNYRFNRKSMAWFTSYLSDSHQAVVHGKGLSAFTYMKSVVPQGSILGPTLFLLFINDLPLFMNYCYSDFFADDATLNTHENKPNKVEEKLQGGADHNAKDWSRQNNMHINYDKTNYMILGRTNKQNVSQEFDIRIDDKHIKKTQNNKLLGIHIDDKLSWSSL